MLRSQGQSAAGYNARRLSRSKVRSAVDLSWDGVGVSHIDPLLTLIEDVSACGLVVCSTFQREIVLASSWSNSSANIQYSASLSRTAGTTFDLFQSPDITIGSTNNKLDFIESSGGSEITITVPGTSGDFATVASNIQTQMNSATGLSGTPYTCTYSLQDDRFTITTSSSYLKILWFSGTNAANSIGRSIGFDVSRDQEGGTSYSTSYFPSPFGSRVMISDPSDNFATSEIVKVASLNTGLTRLVVTVTVGQYSTPAMPAEHTYPAGSIVEPVFNSYIDLQQDQNGDSVFSYESSKGRRGIVSASARFVEAFNA